jgi:hypothetical protein
MAILILKNGQRYQERCPVCNGIHLYDRKERGTYSEMERYLCPDCGHKTLAPVLELLVENVSPSSLRAEDEC